VSNRVDLYLTLLQPLEHSTAEFLPLAVQKAYGCRVLFEDLLMANRGHGSTGC
jgi:hypothetical protein